MDIVKVPPRNPGLKAMEKVAKGFETWRPARDVLLRVEAVPTIFPQFDRATRVGGMPSHRFVTVHGPSNNGKTVLTNGMGLSFLQRGHFFGLIDAENTTPISWLENLMGEYAHHPGFVAIRPKSYEQTVDASRSFICGIGEAVAKKQLPANTRGLVVVDSIRKLVPEGIFAKIMKEGAEGDRGSVDGMGGRAAQIKAALNAAWLDEITVMLNQTGCTMVVIARESEDTNASAQDRKYGKDFKIGGGKALIFDASLVMRVTRSSWTRDGSGDDDKRVIGERHRVRIWKTKVGGKEDAYTDCYFHTSNGVAMPEGYDRARDVVEMAIGYGIVTPGPKGSGLVWGTRKFRGMNQAVAKIGREPGVCAVLEEAVRARFSATEELPGGVIDPTEDE